MSRWIVHAAVELTASHALTSYRGEPEELHTHRWRVEVRAATTALNAEGYALDFHALRAVLAEAAAPLDGTCLNDHPGIGDPSPTAERIALHLARRLEPEVASLGGRLLSVSVWEGPGNRVDLELE
ncbi:MAG TPA: 6-carboxytetrahydropterin synthase [Acidobacteria bacterium]|nr:6-carboxytetrahydropterin synthase [Acidobacteriota bacterium]